ncbi:hypothetical protein HSBAA_47830 [Vreelandella sulfidaeris]|uniref:CDP-alcohol phosphatidyltransferase C-terminal domain-containing protein n=1 Tax=Vreelandella sulfidaeris TaxID=115553 RepID=A0A455UCY8_9GAMM|nr:hypothetical protein HSBAA_47830 [Halomonas sulfidaeris]
MIGITALPLLAYEQYGWALLAIVLNRLGDGVDGALARLSGHSSDAGGFLDIGLDFVFTLPWCLVLRWPTPLKMPW